MRLVLKGRPALSMRLAFLLAVVMLSACTPAAEKKPAAEEETAEPAANLRLLVIDDPPLAAALERQWRGRGEGRLTVTNHSTAELAKLEKLEADLVVYPCASVGDLAERKLIVPVPEDVLHRPELGRTDIFPLSRLQEPTWGQKTYAVPLGAAQLVLYYRRDLFEQQKLTPPETWVEYQRLAALLGDRAKLPANSAPAEGPWFGTAEPCGPGSGGLMLLARAAAMVRHKSHYQGLFDQHTLAPLIDSPPFVRALEELVAAAKSGSPETKALTIEGAREAILSGRCAMAIAWPGHAASAAKATTPPAIGFAELPGSVEVYDFHEGRWNKRREDAERHVPLVAASGRLASVTAESNERRAALAALGLLGSREWMALASPASSATGMVRESQLARSGDWIDAGLDSTAARQFADVVQHGQQRTLWLTVPRLPGHARYLAALDTAVDAAVTGKTEPKAALATAAAEWKKITGELGGKQQLAAYQRSLGLEP